MTESEDGSEDTRDGVRDVAPAVRGFDDLVRSSAPLHLGDGGGALPSAPIISLARSVQPPGMRLPLPGARWAPRS